MTPLNTSPSLIVVSGAQRARRIPVPFGGKVLGRDPRLGEPFTTDQFVSRHHVLVRRIGFSAEVMDLGSANGTYVNGTRVRDLTRLQDGDVLRIGQISLKVAAPGEKDRPAGTGEHARRP